MQKISTKPYKGARDFYPQDLNLRNYIFETWKKVAQKYGYQEYDGPLLEPYELYAAKSGDQLVKEELYVFEDKGERKVAIRPEMTPTLARMVAGQIKTLPRPIRWFSIPNLWRYEKPQRGRLREFYQLNVDMFGVNGIEADFEIISMAIDIMKEFGATSKMFKIKINNRNFMDQFLASINLNTEQSFLTKKAIDKKEKMPAEDFEKILVDQVGLNKNQLNALNDLFINSTNYLKYDYAKQLNQLLNLLNQADLKDFIQFDPTIMRGLDYYTGNVFEQFDLNPLNNRAMYGGGRYDDLVDIFGNEKLSGIGFGMGDVTLINFLETWNLMPNVESKIDYFVCTWPSEDPNKQFEYFLKSAQIAQKIRQKNKNVIQYLDANTAINKQLKNADTFNANFVIIIGEEEMSKNSVTLKNLKTKEQITILEKDFVQNL